MFIINFFIITCKELNALLSRYFLWAFGSRIFYVVTIWPVIYVILPIAEIVNVWAWQCLYG